MKKFLLILLFSFVCAHAETSLAPVPADSLNYRIQQSLRHDAWFGPDKAHHFMASAFITGFTFYAAKQELQQSTQFSNQAALTTALTFGLGKEVYDFASKKGHASTKDIIADVAGIVCGFLIIKVTTE